MRLFYAVDVEPGERLRSLLREMRSIPGAKVMSPDSLHITLRFLGDQDPAMTTELCQALEEAVEGEGPFEMAFRSVGCFPGEHRPRVLWAGVEDGGALPRIVERLERRLQDMGLPGEARPFRPHLTLARLKRPDPSAMDGLSSWKGEELGSMTVSALRLKSSVLAPGGARHEDVCVRSL